MQTGAYLVEQRERDVVCLARKVNDVLPPAWLLLPKLVARESQNLQPISVVLVIHRLQTCIRIRQESTVALPADLRKKIVTNCRYGICRFELDNTRLSFMNRL